MNLLNAVSVQNADKDIIHLVGSQTKVKFYFNRIHTKWGKNIDTSSQIINGENLGN